MLLIDTDLAKKVMKIETYLNQTKPKLEIVTILNDNIGLSQTLLRCSIPCLPDYSCLDSVAQMVFYYEPYDTKYNYFPIIKKSTIMSYTNIYTQKSKNTVSFLLLTDNYLKNLRFFGFKISCFVSLKFYSKFPNFVYPNEYSVLNSNIINKTVLNSKFY